LRLAEIDERQPDFGAEGEAERSPLARDLITPAAELIYDGRRQLHLWAAYEVRGAPPRRLRRLVGVAGGGRVVGRDAQRSLDGRPPIPSFEVAEVGGLACVVVAQRQRSQQHPVIEPAVVGVLVEIAADGLGEASPRPAVARTAFTFERVPDFPDHMPERELRVRSPIPRLARGS
jgi:hypothetical protein